MGEKLKNENIKKFIGQKFKKDWHWYVLQGASLDGKTAFVNLGGVKEAMNAKTALKALQETPPKDRKLQGK